MTGSIDLRSRVALVTGGSRGIGRAIALSFAAASAAVAVNYRERAREAAEVVAAIRSMERRCIAVPADVSLPQPVADMMARIEGELGPVDILVNNAGVATVRELDDLDEAEFDRTIAVNLKSAFLCTRAMSGYARASLGTDRQHLLCRGARPRIVGVHYNASKAGIEGLTRGMPRGSPRTGSPSTPSRLGRSIPKWASCCSRPTSSQEVPVGRFGAVDEVARAVLMVVGNSFITGQTIAVTRRRPLRLAARSNINPDCGRDTREAVVRWRLDSPQSAGCLLRLGRCGRG